MFTWPIRLWFSAVMAIRAVVFDVGGVLAKICTTWEEALGSLGIPCPAHLMGKRHSHFARFDQYQGGSLDHDQYIQELADFLSVTPEEAESAHGAILLVPYPGTEDLVDDLNARGLATACLSNTNAPHLREMLAGRFPAVEKLGHRFTSHEMGLQKPDRAIYEHVARTLGLPGHEILFFDDTEENVVGAREAGWVAYRVDPGGDTAEQMRRAVSTHVRT